MASKASTLSDCGTGNIASISRRFGSGLTGFVGMRQAGEGAEGTCESNERDDLLHFNSPVSQFAFFR